MRNAMKTDAMLENRVLRADLLTRRRFVATAAGAFATTVLVGAEAAAEEKPLVRFGLVTDPHSGSLESTKPPGEVRAFRESPGKMREFVSVMNARKVDFVAELGDFAECHGSRQSTIAALDEIEGVFCGFEGPRYHVIGNHDIQGLPRDEIAKHISNTGIEKGRTYYSFVRGGVTFAVLDHGFYADGTAMGPGRTHWAKGHLSPEQWKWFDEVLGAAKGPVVTLSHWRLDPNGRGGLEALDAGRMREVFVRSGKVKASFCGHHHYGDYGVWDGIGYYCQRAMVTGSGPENSSYAEVAVYPSGRFSVTGFRKARTAEWCAGAKM